MSTAFQSILHSSESAQILPVMTEFMSQIQSKLDDYERSIGTKLNTMDEMHQTLANRVAL